jgi:hypothetical protein
MKALDNLLRLNTEELENRDRDIMVSYKMDVKTYDRFCTKILNDSQVDGKDMDVLMLRLVKKYRKMSGDQIQELKEKLREMGNKKYKLEKSFQKKNAQLKKTDRDKIARQQWSMIAVMQIWLLAYGLVDFTIQILFQMPMVLVNLDQVKGLKAFGFRKVWTYHAGDTAPGEEPPDLGEMTFRDYISCNPWTDGKHNENCPHFQLNERAFYFEVMNCFIVAMIMLQSEIFSSAGYLKYVTQQNGSMDLLIQLSELKAKSITYVWNNYKIRKILSVQRKREATLKTVEKLKEKIQRWRQFTRTTMVNTQPPSTLVASGAVERPADPVLPASGAKV